MTLPVSPQPNSPITLPTSVPSYKQKNGIQDQSPLLRLHSDVLAYLTQFVDPASKVALRASNVRLAQIIENNPKLAKTICKIAAAQGHTEVIKWAITELHAPFAVGDLMEAAGNGHLDTLKWAYTHFFEKYRHPPSFEFLLYPAIEGGQLEVLKWMQQIGMKFKTVEFDSAAENGNMNVLQWACDNSFIKDSQLTGLANRAAWGGKMEVLLYLKGLGATLEPSTLSAAAEGGHLEMVKFLRSENVPWDEGLGLRVAQQGHLVILDWAVKNGYSLPLKACNQAANRGHLNILQWIVDNKLAWNKEDLCEYAAYGGHLSILQWGYAQGAPLDKERVKQIARNLRNPKDTEQIVTWVDTLP